jgi:hypothetical protein
MSESLLTPFEIGQIRQRHALYLDLLRCLEEIERLQGEIQTLTAERNMAQEITANLEANLRKFTKEPIQ